MAPKGRGRKSKAAKQIEGLYTAADFAALGITANGPQAFHSHFRIANGWIVGFNGVVAAGHKIDSDLEGYPNAEKLLAALARCREAVNITMLDSDRLSVKSGDFRAYIECLEDGLYPDVAPSGNMAPCGQELLDGIKLVSEFTTDSETRVPLVTLLFDNGTVTGTNGHIFMQYWHGYNLPRIAVPYSAAQAFRRCGLEPTGFGVDFGADSSINAATVWFGETAFIKTQLYGEGWPPIEDVMTQKTNKGFEDIPSNFFDIVDDLAPFADDNTIFFGSETVSTTPPSADGDMIAGASQSLEMSEEFAINPKYLAYLRDKVSKAVWNDANRSILYGDRFRVAVAHKHVEYE